MAGTLPYWIGRTPDNRPFLYDGYHDDQGNLLEDKSGVDRVSVILDLLDRYLRGERTMDVAAHLRATAPPQRRQHRQPLLYARCIVQGGNKLRAQLARQEAGDKHTCRSSVTVPVARVWEQVKALLLDASLPERLEEEVRTHLEAQAGTPARQVTEDDLRAVERKLSNVTAQLAQAYIDHTTGELDDTVYAAVKAQYQTQKTALEQELEQLQAALSQANAVRQEAQDAAALAVYIRQVWAETQAGAEITEDEWAALVKAWVSKVVIDAENQPEVHLRISDWTLRYPVGSCGSRISRPSSGRSSTRAAFRWTCIPAGCA